jgi:hypothetical protein
MYMLLRLHQYKTFAENYRQHGVALSRPTPYCFVVWQTFAYRFEGKGFKGGHFTMLQGGIFAQAESVVFWTGFRNRKIIETSFDLLYVGTIFDAGFSCPRIMVLVVT